MRPGTNITGRFLEPYWLNVILCGDGFNLVNCAETLPLQAKINDFRVLSAS